MKWADRIIWLWSSKAIVWIVGILCVLGIACLLYGLTLVVETFWGWATGL